MGNNSSITADSGNVLTGSGAALNLTGAGTHNFSANSLTLLANGASVKGVNVDGATQTSTIEFGTNSSITTAGESGTGIRFGSNALATMHASQLSLTTSCSAANGVELHNGFLNIDDNSQIISQHAGGILAVNEGATSDQQPTVHLSDSLVTAQTFGVRSQGGGAAVNLISSKIQAANGAALESVNGGSISAEDVILKGTSGIVANTAGKVSL